MGRDDRPDTPRDRKQKATAAVAEELIRRDKLERETKTRDLKAQWLGRDQSQAKQDPTQVRRIDDGKV